MFFRRTRDRSLTKSIRLLLNLFLLIQILSLVTTHDIQAGESSYPFVAGFDRFAKHNQTTPESAGRLLISELSCVACHPSSDPTLNPKSGPVMNGAGTRLQSKWIEEFLHNPSKTKPGTTMPDMLHSLPPEKKNETISALVAYLSSLKEPYKEPKATGANPVPYEFWRKGNSDRGQKLYHQVGCVACHQPDENYEGGSEIESQFDKQLEQLDPEEIEELGLTHLLRPVNSIPHPDLKSKYTQKSLTFFLMKPEQVRPSGRMPDLKLKAVEASDLAAYLLKDQKTAPSEIPDESLIKKGKDLFVELKCINCHQVKGLKPASLNKPLDQLTVKPQSCLNDTNENLPNYHLDPDQQESIKQTLETLKDPKNQFVPKDQLELTLLKLNCYACHERDEKGGIGRNRKQFFETTGHVDVGDEGRLPPQLTHLGKKMHAKWMKQVLDGKAEIRPFMTIRMPKFPAHMTSELPSLFATSDGYKKMSEKAVFGETKGLAEEGRKLLNTGCVQCHQLKGETAPGVLGIDLEGIQSRVHPEWFKEFLLNPVSLKDRTRMPTFFPNGKSSNPQILDGDVDRQIAAIWVYLKELNQHPLPEKILTAKSRDTELVPEKEPILLRTFMKKAGTHAIAVGFPEKIHYAFDAENVRLAQGWKGRFLDAEGTWYTRLAPPADPLGTEIISLSKPDQASFALLDQKTQNWPENTQPVQFLGYRLDKQKIPTYIYRLGDYLIEDKITPEDQKGLTRHFTIIREPRNSGNQSPGFLLNEGKTLKENNPSSMTNPQGLTVSVSESVAKNTLVQKVKNSQRWILPLDSISEFEVKYQW